MKEIKKMLGSGFYSGYVPYAPGTFGSMVAFLIFMIPGFEKLTIIIPAIIFAVIIGIPIGDYFETLYGKDPGKFTLDEFIGTWITFLLVPKNWMILLGGFILWRILDIIKPFPAKQAEKIHGGTGIILDDIVSGVYSFVIIHIFIFLFNLT